MKEEGVVVEKEPSWEGGRRKEKREEGKEVKEGRMKVEKGVELGGREGKEEVMEEIKVGKVGRKGRRQRRKENRRELEVERQEK